jgi:SAM-dependent methyltransferase
MGSPHAARSGLVGVFQHRSVAEAYRHRPAYPAEVFTILEQLLGGDCRAVLDIGAGEGALARPLAARVDRVDAVEVSAAMVDVGRQRPGGRRDNLRWIVGAVETCELQGPYALVTAGASVHWMSWHRVMRRLAAVTTDPGFLAIVDHGPRDLPWREELAVVIGRHSRSRDFDPGYSLVDALRQAKCLDVVGHAETVPVLFRQTIDAYVEHFHSTASLARELMSPEEAACFDAAVGQVVRPWSSGGFLEMQIVANVTWGHPHSS